MHTIFSFLRRIFFEKRFRLFLLIFGIIFSGICFGADGANSSTYTESDITKEVIELLNLIFAMLAMVLGPMVILCGWLLSPDWTMGDFFGLRPYFKEVWVLVANIVYIIFALMLLYMAVMQIFGTGENNYAFKKKLPQFLVGILMVPFTWLIVSWTLSFANQAVAAVLSIPMGAISKTVDTEALTGKQSTSLWHKKVLPTEFSFDVNTAGYGDVTCTGGSTKSGVKCISPAEFLTYNESGPYFIIMIYAYNIFKIQNADLTNVGDFCSTTESGGTTKYETGKSCISSLVAILRKFGISLIVTIFFAFMLIALCWVLLMRAVKLWIYIMLSPLFGLAYFTGKGFSESVGEAGESGFGQVGFMQFFSLAFVPVLVAAVLAFGLLFVGVVRDNFHGGNVSNTGEEKTYCTEQKVGYMVTYCIEEKPGGSGEKSKYSSKLIIGTDSRSGEKSSLITLNFGDAFSEIVGSGTSASVLGAADGAITSVEDLFAHIILTMLALIFMFMGVKMAVSHDAVTKAAFEPFRKLGESVGNFVAHSPSYLPLPHPAFAAFNPAMISRAADMINTNVANKEADMGRSLHDIMGGKTSALNKAIDNLSTASGSLDDVARVMKNMEYKDPKEARDAILKAIDNSKDEIKNHEEVKKFRAEIDADGGGKRIANTIEKFPAAVDVMEKGDRTRGIRKIGEYQGAQLESASQPFYNAKLDGGNIAIGGRNVVTKNGTDYTIGNLNPEERSHINRVLSSGVIIPRDNSGVEKLFKDALNLDLTEAQLSAADKRKILEAIKQR